MKRRVFVIILGIFLSSLTFISAEVTNWTALPNGTIDTGIKFGSSNVYSVAYGNGTFVAVGADSKASYSYNGINWTALPNGTIDTGIKFGT